MAQMRRVNTRRDGPFDRHRLPLPGYALTLQAMIAHRPSTRILVLLCLLALQMQLFASSAMACKHAARADGTEVAGCHYHPGDTALPGGDGGDAMLNCQKCVLALLFGVYHPAAPAFGLVVSGASPIEIGGAVTHFYRFVPDRLFRPPISIHL